MTNPIVDLSMRKAAIVAGITILIMTVAAIAATDLTIGSLIVEDNAAVTTNNIQASETLFRTGIFSWLIILICDVLAAWGLYIFLKLVNNSLSLIMAWFRLVYAAILGAAILNFIDVLSLIGGDGYLNGFDVAQVQSMVMRSINGFYALWSVGLIIFGIHIYLLGYLIVKSGYMPKTLGILLLLASIGYIATNLIDLLLPAYEAISNIIEWIFILPMLSEVALGFWLLLKGGKISEKSI